MRMTISEYLSDVLQDWRRSRNDFPKNEIKAPHWPMPFFGNPANALVATVGVNPASGEFEDGRGWEDVKTGSEWKRRARDYFNQQALPHDWFDPWRIGLELLGVSYEHRTAAHFDVSYRPTKAMIRNTTTDRREFGRMVERDVGWLFRLLPICENLRLLLVFGPILRPDGSIGNLAHFLRNQAPQHGFTLTELGNLQHTETGKLLVVHEADTRNEKCVTCRVVKNLHTHRHELRRLLEPTKRRSACDLTKKGNS